MYHIKQAVGMMKPSWEDKLKEAALGRDPWNFPGDIFEQGKGWRKFTAEERELADAEEKYRKAFHLVDRLKKHMAFDVTKPIDDECETCGRRLGLR